MTENLLTSWDGLPISPEPPFGASIVVYRHQQGQIEFLILHRAHDDPEYDGEWAWTPPSGARLPNEAIDDCARRELRDETGLALPVQPAEGSAESWAIYFAEATPDDRVVLDAEHDRFAWVTLEAALAHCLPEMVGSSVEYVARLLHLV
jgi:8-oxo-dGTP pyrophosphatase MutT (NUDIX family)